MVTGILQGTHLFPDFKTCFASHTRPHPGTYNSLYRPTTSYVVPSDYMKEYIHPTSNHHPAPLLLSYSATRCLSGADARDDSPQKLKRTKDGNIAPPWPNKVTLLFWQFFCECRNTTPPPASFHLYFLKHSAGPPKHTLRQIPRAPSSSKPAAPVAAPQSQRRNRQSRFSLPDTNVA